VIRSFGKHEMDGMHYFEPGAESFEANGSKARYAHLHIGRQLCFEGLLQAA